VPAVNQKSWSFPGIGVGLGWGQEEGWLELVSWMVCVCAPTPRSLLTNQPNHPPSRAHLPVHLTLIRPWAAVLTPGSSFRSHTATTWRPARSHTRTVEPHLKPRDGFQADSART
jgi:hypothetical protein